MQKFVFFAPCAKGLELLLKDELLAAGGENVSEKLAGVHFEGNLEVAYRACLWSRLANHVLLHLSSEAISSPEALYNAVYRIHWNQHFNENSRFKIDVTGSHLAFKNTQFAAQKAKDAIVDQFRDKYDKRPDIDLDNPDIVLNIHLGKQQSTIYLSLSGASLHRRGYRISQGKAPLKETLAAAILYRSGWPDYMKNESEAVFIDPMCGSGTLLIEAAMIACDIAPGLNHNFGFEKWRGHAPELWQRLVDEAKTRKQQGLVNAKAKIIGYDISPFACKHARENIEAAGLSDYIEVYEADAAMLTNEMEVKSGLIVTNPPYGERLYHEEHKALELLFRAFGKQLIKEFSGFEIGIFTASKESAQALGLRSYKHYNLYNGAIETRLYKFHVADEWIKKQETTAQKYQRLAQKSITLNDDYKAFANRINKNYKSLTSWAHQQNLDCYRIYDADLPEYAAAIDIYNTHVHIQEYEAGKNVDAKVAENRLYQMLYVLHDVLDIDYARMHVKQRRRQSGKDQYERLKDDQNFYVVREDRALFHVNLDDYLDTGLFLDHRKLRQRIATETKGKRFLNLFAYTCTASVHAGLAGARSITSVDMSKTYLEWGQRNFQLNKLKKLSYEFIQEDCFKWLKQALAQRLKFDVIFLDPPTFSNSKKMSHILDIQRDHVALINLAMSLLDREGVLYFSNNYRKFKLDEALEKKYHCENIDRLCLSRDFMRRPNIHHCWRITR
ncbi:MAG: bifunctional 23S rRNA (guanine(2069)-N(7))-methyltransferase RlmK/23S rRNA (guanine(2445)-N(2))-methyltransferase RlmL [Francisellaceae bacterium]